MKNHPFIVVKRVRLFVVWLGEKGTRAAHIFSDILHLLGPGRPSIGPNSLLLRPEHHAEALSVFTACLACAPDLLGDQGSPLCSAGSGLVRALAGLFSGGAAGAEAYAMAVAELEGEDGALCGVIAAAEAGRGGGEAGRAAVALIMALASLVCEALPAESYVRWAKRARDVLVEGKMLPHAALALSVHVIGDVGVFLLGMLGAGGGWFWEYLRGGRGGDRREAADRDQLLGDLAAFLKGNRGLDPQLPRPLADAAWLRVRCRLFEIPQLWPGADEATEILALLSRPGITPRLVEVGSCFLVTCPNLMRLSAPSAVREAFAGLLSAAAADDRDPSQLGSVTLAVSCYLSLGYTSEVVDLVGSALGFAVGVHDETLASLRETLLAQPEAVVSRERLARLIISRPCSGLVQPAASHMMACVSSLLRERVFSSHGIDPGPWVLDLIRGARAPLGQHATAIVSTFAESCSRFPLVPFSAQAVGSVLADASGLPEVPRLLMLLYAATFARREVQGHVEPWRPFFTYCEGATIRKLLRFASSNAGAPADLYERIAPLLMDIAPHLLDARLVLAELDYEDLLVSRGLAGRADGPTAGREPAAPPRPPQQPGALAAWMRDLAWAPPSALRAGFPAALAALFPAALAAHEDHAPASDAWAAACSAFASLFSATLASRAVPFEMVVARTAEALLCTCSGATPRCFADLVADPAGILSCHPAVHRNPGLLAVLFELLSPALATSRATLAHLSRARAGASLQDEALAHAVAQTQDSAVAQLAITLLSRVADQPESVTVVCAFLHQLFMDGGTPLIKLVHFQGYPPEVIPVLIKNVPSLHVCVEFIPELLQRPEPFRRLFACELFSYLVRAYPFARTHTVALSLLDLLDLSLQLADYSFSLACVQAIEAASSVIRSVKDAAAPSLERALQRTWDMDDAKLAENIRQTIQQVLFVEG